MLDRKDHEATLRVEHRWLHLWAHWSRYINTTNMRGWTFSSFQMRVGWVSVFVRWERKEPDAVDDQPYFEREWSIDWGWRVPRLLARGRSGYSNFTVSVKHGTAVVTKEET